MMTVRPVRRIDGELHVRAAGFDADGRHHLPGQVAQYLVLGVGQRLRRRHGDAVAGVHAHRVEVLDAAHHHEVVGAVAHHLELVLLPAHDRLLDPGLANRRLGDGLANGLGQLLRPVDPGRAAAAEGEGGAHEQRVSGFLRDGLGLGERGRRAAGRDGQASPNHRLAKDQPVLGGPDRIQRRAQQCHAVPLQHAVLAQRQRQVEPGLPAHGRQHRVRTLLGDDGLQHLGRGRLDVGHIGQIGVGHDRGRVGVDQNDLVALLA